MTKNYLILLFAGILMLHSLFDIYKLSYLREVGRKAGKNMKRFSLGPEMGLVISIIIFVLIAWF